MKHVINFILMAGVAILFQRQTSFPLIAIIMVLIGLLIWRW